MVQITSTELGRKIERTHEGQRTPLLNAFCESLAWPTLSKGSDERARDLRTYIYNITNGENYLTSIAISQVITKLGGEKNSKSYNVILKDYPGWIALGSAQQRKDGTFCLYFVLDVTAAKIINETGPRFKLLQFEKLDVPIYSLDWSGPHLLVGSDHGLVRFYTVRHKDEGRPLVLVAEYKAPVSQMTYMNGPMYIQGQYPMNSKIKCIEFAANYSADYVYQRWQPLGDLPVPEHHEMTGVSSRFLNTFCNHVNVWDALAEDAPSSSIKVHQSRLNCASWSPHAPYTLIVAGGCAKSLHVIDTRANRTVWTAPEAHDRAIRDAKFNTFIPYWLASGGEDGVVNIFDIRATSHATVAKITGHEGVVASLTWSNIRPENLATTSGDGTFRMWMLRKDAVPISDAYYRTRKWSKDETPPAAFRPDERFIRQSWCGANTGIEVPWVKADINPFSEDKEDPWGHSLDLEPQTMLLAGAVGLGGWGQSGKGPVYIGEDVEKSKGQVVKVQMSKTRLADYYCITTMGQFCVQNVRMEDGDNIKYQYKFDKNRDPIARQIEYYFYTRSITQAREELQKLKHMVIEDEQKESERQEQIAYLEECLKIRDAIQPDTWGIDTIPDEMESKRRLWTPQDRWDLAVSVFQKDLEYWSHRLPPDYAAQHHFALDYEKDAVLFTALPPLDHNDLADVPILPNSPTPPVLPNTEEAGTFDSGENMSHRPSSSPSHRSLSHFSSRGSATADGKNENLVRSNTGLPGLRNKTKSLRRMFSHHSAASAKAPSIDRGEQREGNTENLAPVHTIKWRARRNAVFRPS